MDFSRFDTRHYPTLSVEAGYAEWAGVYDATVINQMDVALLDRVRLDWALVDRALDLACGTGRIGAWLRGRAVRYIDGIDLTPEMLAHARVKGVYDEMYQGDARATGLRDGEYELLTMVLADEHVPDLRPLYDEAVRLLRPGGHMVNVGHHPHFLLNGIRGLTATWRSPCRNAEDPRSTRRGSADGERCNGAAPNAASWVDKSYQIALDYTPL